MRKAPVDRHETKAKSRAAPAAPPRVAVVGAGYWGKNVVRNCAELAALAAVCDPDRANASPLTERHKVPLAEFAGALADDTIAGVAVAAPAALHAQLARAALEAGKHVFVEKSLALDLAEADHLCALAERRGLRLMVGHLLQYHPTFVKLRELVASGALGRLQYLYSNRLNLGSVQREEDILWSFAPHDISMILSLVGAEPAKVGATGACFLYREIADVTMTHLCFAGGEQAHIFVSQLPPFKEQKLVVVGDRAMSVFDDGELWSRKLQLYSHRIEWRATLPVPQRAEAEPVPLPEAEPLKLELQHFLECIASGAQPRTDGREGVPVLRVLAKPTAALAVSGRRRAGRGRGGAASSRRADSSNLVRRPARLDRRRDAHFPSALGGVPVSDRLAREVVSLPMHPYLDAATQDRTVVTALAAF